MKHHNLNSTHSKLVTQIIHDKKIIDLFWHMSKIQKFFHAASSRYTKYKQNRKNILLYIEIYSQLTEHNCQIIVWSDIIRPVSMLTPSPASPVPLPLSGAARVGGQNSAPERYGSVVGHFKQVTS